MVSTLAKGPRLSLPMFAHEAEAEPIIPWSRREVYIVRGERRGLFRPDPHQVRPLEDMADPTVDEVSLLWASQGLGKSTLLPVRIGWGIDQRQEDMLLMHASDKGLDKFLREKLRPMLQGSPTLWRKVRTNNRGDISAMGFDFDGGGLTMTTPRSVSGDHGNTARVVMADELDDYGPDFDVDGLIQRGITFGDAKRIFLSTPHRSDPSKIMARYMMGSQCWRYVPCQRCGRYQILTLDLVRGGGIVCVECSTVWAEGDRLAALQHGRWAPQNPRERRRRSYWCSQLYSVGVPLARTLRSMDGMSPAHIGTQIGAWPYEEREIPPLLPEQLPRLVPDWRPVIRTAGVDVQQRALLWAVVDYDAQLQRKHVRAAGVVPRVPDSLTHWTHLRSALAPWRVQRLTVDIGYQPDHVMTGLQTAFRDAFTVADDPIVEGVRGAAKAQGSFGEPLRGAKRTAGWFIGAVDEAKVILHQDGGAGRLTLHPDLPTGAEAEICAEVCVRRTDARGNVRLAWINPEDAPNHLLDCCVYSLMGALAVYTRLAGQSPSPSLHISGIE